MNLALQDAELIKMNTLLKESEEKRTEEQAQNEFKYQSLVESSMDAILLTVKEGRILTANAAACGIFQMTVEELCSSGRLDIVDSTDPRLSILLEERDRTGRAKGELTFKRKDGSKFPGEITSVVFTDACGQEKTSMIIRDITERKQAEQALKASESFNKGILDSLTSHIAVINAKGTILKVNKSWNTFAQNNGGDASEKYGEGANYFDACRRQNNTTDEFASQVLKGIKDVLNGDINDFYLEYPCHSPVTKRWFNMRINLFEGSETMILIEHHDISERKMAEQNLAATTDALQHTLNDLNNILDSSMDVICSFDQEGRFLSINAASERIWGYKPKELLGKNFMDFLYHEDIEKTVKTDASIKGGEPVTIFENRYVHKDGRIVPLIWSSRWDEKDKKSYGIAKDATKKKELEKAFEIERQRFIDLFLQAPSCMGILKGPNHIYEMANPLYLQLIGKSDIIDKTVKEVLPELEAQGIFEFLNTVYKTGETFSANEMLVQFDHHGNGQLVDTYLSFIYQAHRDSYGTIDGIFFFANDVTEQVLSRKKIEESEKKYRFLFENNPMPMWIIDEITFKFLDVNEMAILRYGYNREEFLSMTAIDIRPEEDKERFTTSKYSSDSNETNFNRGIWNHLDKNGTIFPVEIIAQKITYEGVPSRFILANDITDRKKAELNLEIRDKEIRDYKFAMDESSIVGITDHEGIIISANDNFCKISQYSREELIGQDHRILSSGYHDKEYIRNLWTTIADGKTWKGEIKNKAKDGTFYWVDTTIIPFLDAQGKPYQYFATRFDITERKKADLILEKQNQQLIKTNSELDRFVYSVSHDLRSPLTSILGLLSLIETESEEPDTLEHAEMIRNSINRLDAFIKNILSYSRNNRTGLEIENIPIQETAHEIVESLQSMEEAKGIHYEIDIKEQQPFYTDRLRFNTILENLISNAIKYHRKEQSGRYIKILGHSDHEKLQITISDNGIGIAPEHHQKIFDMFFRLSGKKDGSGIGLYIVKDTIAMLQGSIEIQSEKGIGTTFSITLKNLKP